MKKFKTLFTLVLTTAVTFGSTFLSETFAAEKTKNDAVSWANAQIGKSLDYDGAYGAQCVDLIAYYYSFLGKTVPGGNGCDYATNALPAGWQRIQYYNGFIAQLGDIAVWTYGVNSYGHVGIVVSADANSFTVVDQNGKVMGAAAYTTYRYSGTSMRFFGVIRPNFNVAPDTVKGTHTVTNVGNGKALNCYVWNMSSLGNYTKINTYDKVGDATQRFTFEEYENGYIIKTQSENFLLNVMSRYNSGAQAIAYNRYQDIEPWLVERCGAGYAIRLRNNASMALTANADGSVCLMPYIKSAAQQWILE